MLTGKFRNKSIMHKKRNYHNPIAEKYKLIQINTFYIITDIYITGNKVCGAKLCIKTHFECKYKFKCASFVYLFIFNFYFYFILLYNTVLVLPYIDMNVTYFKQSSLYMSLLVALVFQPGALNTVLILDCERLERPPGAG